jgi:hypothetical protein
MLQGKNKYLGNKLPKNENFDLEYSNGTRLMADLNMHRQSKHTR